MVTPKQILENAKFITSYNGYDIYRLRRLLLKLAPKTGIITGTVITEGKNIFKED